MQPRKPLYSTLEEDSDFLDAISRFVIELAETVDALQDLCASGDLGSLSTSCQTVAERAATLGYPLFEQVALAAASAAADGKPGPAEEVLRELTELSLRIRGAHKGAA